MNSTPIMKSKTSLMNDIINNNPKLSFNDMCTNGIYSIRDKELSDDYELEYNAEYYWSDCGSDYDSNDEYESDENDVTITHDYCLVEKEFMLGDYTVGTINLLTNTDVKVEPSKCETPINQNLEIENKYQHDRSV